MQMRIISMKGGFPPDVGGVLTASLVRTQLRARALAEETVEFLQMLTPYRSGFMRSQVKYWNLRTYARGGFTFYFGWRKSDFAGKVFYPPYVDQGTGLYGKYKQRIYPKKAERLVWKHRGEWASAKSIAGQRKQRLLSHAYRFARKKARVMFQSEVLSGMKAKFK